MVNATSNLALPSFQYKVQSSVRGCEIFDISRRKYVRLTAEEWVRQHLLHYLIGYLGYPSALIKTEHAIPGSNRRADLVAYSRAADPLLLVECKAPGVALSQSAWQQLMRYNHYFRVPAMVITNGLKHLCWVWHHCESSFIFSHQIPSFSTLCLRRTF